VSVPDDQPHTRTRYPAGEQSPAPQPAGLRSVRVLVAVLGAVVVLVVALAVLNRTGGSSTPPATAGGTSVDGGGKATAPSGTQPVTTTQDGIATGFPHTDEGAQSAAVNYAVALGSSDMYSDSARHSIVTTVADPSALTKLLGRFDPSYTAMSTKLGLQNGKGPSGLTFVSRTIPAGTKTDSYDGDHATVEVWTTGLIGLAGTGSTQPVTEYWQTSTLQLHWSNNDWKVLDATTKDGPTPVNGSQTISSAEDIAGAVSQFGGFRYAR
jgi:hypothetical protein